MAGLDGRLCARDGFIVPSSKICLKFPTTHYGSCGSEARRYRRYRRYKTPKNKTNECSVPYPTSYTLHPMIHSKEQKVLSIVRDRCSTFQLQHARSMHCDHLFRQFVQITGTPWNPDSHDRLRAEVLISGTWELSVGSCGGGWRSLLCGSSMVVHATD